jgi:DNA-directed RNA polymerase subunit RPC12/RpoP
LICLFVTQPKIPLCLIAWLATNFIVYQIGLFWGGSHELAGFLAGFSYTFGVHPKIFDLFVRAASAYLFLGSYTSLWCLRKYPTSVPDPPTVALQPVKIQRDTKALVRTLKIACTACGGHIEFPTNSFGEKVPCPHCHTTITLQKSRSLRMACPACAGRIEFPEYAIGQTIPCPHCKTGITLKEPA